MASVWFVAEKCSRNGQNACNGNDDRKSVAILISSVSIAFSICLVK